MIAIYFFKVMRYDANFSKFSSTLLNDRSAAIYILLTSMKHNLIFCTFVANKIRETRNKLLNDKNRVETNVV